MYLLSGIRKIFAKRDLYASPNDYLLNSKEKESVIVFFSTLFIVGIIAVVLLSLN